MTNLPSKLASPLCPCDEMQSQSARQLCLLKTQPWLQGQPHDRCLRLAVLGAVSQVWYQNPAQNSYAYLPNPCVDPFFKIISMLKGQLMEMQGQHLYEQESNQATIKAQTSHIKELTVEIKKTGSQAAELQTQYLEVHNALLIASKNLANHKKAKEESALSVKMASLENRARWKC
jgi:hypothetical protein